MIVENRFSTLGYFWFPSFKQDKFYGKLIIENNGKVTLEVFGSFNKTLHSYFNDNKEIKRILGETEKGYVTLEKCFVISSSHKIDKSISKNKIYVTTLFSNNQYEEDENILFNIFSFSVDGLNEWLNIRKIKTIKNTIESEGNQNYIFNLNEKLKLEFRISVSISSEYYESSMKQSSRIELISDEKKPFEYFIQNAEKIVKFLSFGIDKSINIKDVIVMDNDIYNIFEDKKFPIEIEVYSQIIYFVKDVPKIESYTMLFQYTDIEDSFEQKINNWIEAYNNIESALNLFFSIRYNSNQYLESQFLFLAQALETYHRQLYHSNKNFKVRIEELLIRFKKYIGTDDEVKSLVENIKITRNYYTHYEKKLLDKGVTSSNKLIYLIKKIEGILQLLILTQIGFNDIEIENIFNRNNRLKDKFLQ